MAAADGYGGVLGRVHPEYAAGGFTRVDGLVEFYQPPYVADSELVMRVVRATQRILPPAMYDVLMIFMRKRED